MLTFAALVVSTIVQLAFVMVLIISSYALTVYFLAFLVIALRALVETIKVKISSSKLFASLARRARKFTSKDRKGNDPLTDTVVSGVA